MTLRLLYLGYVVGESDDWALQFICNQVENEIKNQCNINSIPPDLQNAVVDRVCGAFLFSKKQSGQLVSFDLSPVAKSISEGDVSVSFSEQCKTPEQRLDSLIEALQSSTKGQLAIYRCIKW